MAKRSPFEVWVPVFPPSTNTVYRRRGHGSGMFMTDRGREWMDTAMWSVRTARGYRPGMFPLAQRVMVLHSLVPPTERAYDIDNFDKLVFDLLQHTDVLENDSQVYATGRLKHDKQGDGEVQGSRIIVAPLPAGFGSTLQRFDALADAIIKVGDYG